MSQGVLIKLDIKPTAGAKHCISRIVVIIRQRYPIFDLIIVHQGTDIFSLKSKSASRFCAPFCPNLSTFAKKTDNYGEGKDYETESDDRSK